MFGFFQGGSHKSREAALKAAVESVMRHRARDGDADLFPEAVMVRFEVKGEGLAPLRSLIARPDFAREVEGRVLNRLARSGPEVLPALEFEAVRGEEDRCLAEELRRPVPTALVLRDSTLWWGRVFQLPASERVFLLGSTPWRGNSPASGENDIVLPRNATWVGPCGAHLERYGSRLLVTPGPGLRPYVRARHADKGRIDPDPSDRLLLGVGDRLFFFGQQPDLVVELHLSQGGPS